MMIKLDSDLLRGVSLVVNGADDKLRGGFYTPKVVADFLVDWAEINNDSTILEGSCGNGIFLSCICNKFHQNGLSLQQINSHLIGIELNEKEANEARRLLITMNIQNAQDVVVNGDFFDICEQFIKISKKFSIVIGNPPFIRYQDFPLSSKQKAFALINKLFDFQLSGHANSWIAFLLLSTQLLTRNGKLAMVIPAQLFQVNYAKETRQLLSSFFRQLTIISFQKLIFPGAEQEVVLLLGEKNQGKSEGIRVIELKDENDLYLRIKPSDISKNFKYYTYKPMDHSTEKWTQYFLEIDEIELLRKVTSNFYNKGNDLYSVDIGVVTGKNKYFLLSEKDRSKQGIDREYTKRIVTKSSDIQGILFSNEDWEKLKKADRPCYLFTPPKTEYENFPQSVKDYILEGVRAKANQGFKCRIREENWYHVPTIYAPDAFMLRQIHDYPKLVLNVSKATCTDTIHRVSFSQSIDPRKITVAFLNSLTFAISEVKGRSYGGGVLTLEPSEAEQLIIPTIGIDRIDWSKTDEDIRQNRINDVLDRNDDILLREGLDLKEVEIEKLRKVWNKLKNRRINRKRSALSFVS